MSSQLPAMHMNQKEQVDDMDNYNRYSIYHTNIKLKDSATKDRNEKLELNLGQRFIIEADSNPTTGYKWIPFYNTSIIELVSHNFKPSIPIRIGSSAIDSFTFKSIGLGVTELKMVYKRSTEEPPAKEKMFSILVS